MPFVIKAHGYARAGRPCNFVGQYLEWYDPDIPDGTKLMATFTPDISKAKKFATFEDAFDEWNRVRSVDPIRPDGKPNKPLTAASVTFELAE